MVARTGVVVGSSPVTLALDVPVVTVSGTITVDGPAGPPGILGGSGELYLVSDSGVAILGERGVRVDQLFGSGRSGHLRDSL